MMGDVKSLSVVPVVRAHEGVPDKDLITLIEELLGRVKSGAIQSVAFAAVYSDEAYQTDWSGSASCIATKGAISMLAHHFSNAMDDMSETEEKA